MKSLISFILLSLSISTLAQTTLTVTNLNDSGPGSLRQQIFNSNAGDTVQFDPALLANGSDTLHLLYTISLTHGLTIKGGNVNLDTLYISGGDSVQLFYIDKSTNPGGVFYFDNLALINGKSLLEGGAIYCTDADSLILNNCVFRNNTSGINYGGGAVLVRYGYCEVVNNKFEINTAYNRGGGIRSVFNDSIYLEDCTFKNNIANEGGGVFIVGSPFHLKACTFSRDSALSYEGGGISIQGSDFGRLDDCNFIQNYTTSQGGGLASYYSDSIVINRCYFESNIANSAAGAVMFTGTKTDLSYSTFSNNQADYGGALYLINGGMLNLYTCTFSNNIARTESNDVRGTGINYNIDKCTFINTRNTRRLFQAPGSGMNITSSVFHYRNSSFVGGWSNITSGGNNVFSKSVPFSIASDVDNLSGISLLFEPLSASQNMPPVRLPKDSTNYILNAGNPTDFSDAQNGPIYGRRDIGAAERPVISYDTTSACTPVNWWGNTYSTAGTYTDTAFNSNSIDSVGVLILMRQDTSVYDLNGTLYASEQDTNTTYQWVDCTNNYAIITGATSRGFIPPANGSYAVILTNQNCVDTSSCISYNRFSISERSSTEDWLTFYPNPSSGTIHYSFTGNAPTQVEVLDLSGRNITTFELDGESTLHLTNLVSGTYLLRWISNDGNVQVDRICVGF
ncbi:T9SS type A sorting domain-containing protein [Phaeocystidibacter marisrubri]|uniref:T9SS type A sorting domain-containing protein n=1 Tax=Phaeocystidibacter marisrubri TaxID=1577780 RepID=A0A6L3ZDS5_9FLAO|nr:T9SS type A sorting domain-containing protein [Phaeocystidibacter marisrubri]KAB2815971.1 T9SS type A sorting domain-containing protein [Phaeocystidibacter marisrubri]GGH66661.1 hypothetical protein GCM10011318_04860 [Phaeocystidibacter marisrubri]